MSGAKTFFRSGVAVDLASSSGRLIRYRFSTPEVARDRHTIQAWKLDNFRANPVFLWAHRSGEPPIGKVVEIADSKGYLDGTVEYAEAGIYPFADTIFQLVRGGYINAVSTSWDPIDYKFTTDRERPGGIDFKLVDLLELSQVPVPALPTALATARSHGIDTGPLFDWCEKVLDEGGMILVPRTELEELRHEAKMPAAAKSSEFSKVVRELEKKQQDKRDALKRDLYQVSWLAYLLSDLDNLSDDVEYEAEAEGDGSTLPARIDAVKKELGAILVALAGEEVAEMFDDSDDGDESDVMSMPRAKRAVLDRLRKLKNDEPLAFAAAMQNAVEGRTITLPIEGDTFARAGKAISAKNEKALRDAHDHLTRGCDMLRSALDEATDGDTVGEEEKKRQAQQAEAEAEAARIAEEEKAKRLRRAKALKLKLSAL